MKKILTAQYKKTFWVGVFLFIFFIGSYLFGVSSSVFNTVALKDAEIQSSELRSKLALLETKYIAKDKEIDKNLATELGFKEVKGSVFSYAGRSSSVGAHIQ